MNQRKNWTNLKSQFITGDWTTISSFFRDKGIKDNSRVRSHTAGWLQEQVNYQDEIVRKTREQVLEKTVNVRVRQQKIAQQLQLKGLAKLQESEVNDYKTAFRMLVAGLQEERAALGIYESRLAEEIVKPIAGKTNLDKMVETMPYEELLKLIAELKRFRGVSCQSSDKTVIDTEQI